MMPRVATILATCVLAGCQKTAPTPLFRLHVPTAAEDWDGPESIDPAGDIAKLQGRWRVAGPMGPPEREVYLIVEGNVATFDQRAFVDRGELPQLDRMVFVLNSSLNRKVIVYKERLGDGRPYYRHDGDSQWYNLNGDNLTLHTCLPGNIECPGTKYERIKSW